MSDSDLHAFVAELCRAELREAGIDPTYVHSGGHQDAPDGGVDIKIEMPQSSEKPDSRFFQRAHIIIQIKKSDMPPSKIKNEMLPKESLRSAVKKLVEDAGAYIIVSSESVVAEKVSEREETMRRVMVEADSEGRAQVHFIDGSCLAAWAEKHPCLVLWVKNLTGRPQDGWRPYETWADVPEGGKNDYITDGQARLFNDRKPGETGLSLIDGVHLIRQELNRPRSSVRLIGLSGVGKTRFVQALFEDSVGGAPLSPSLAVYTDAALRQNPTPTGLLEQLAAQQRRAVVILDNCKPELHAEADKICRRENSRVSMISVEYDVRDDIARESGVFRLEASDKELIERLVRQHHPHISSTDAEKIAEFAGGNARVADALADTVKDGQTITGLRNEALFARLFKQRNTDSGDLMQCAEALSLVYSYDFEGIGVDSELEIIGEIAGKTAKELREASADLQERRLVQVRSKWRAVLPHAVANRLAEKALKKFPRQQFCEPVKTWRTQRLLRSFSHRLKYLETCSEAAEIVNAWLAPDGWLGTQIANPDLLDPSVWENIVLVSPELVLSAIERATENDSTSLFASRKNRHYQLFVRLLRIAAHEDKNFDRCMKLLIPFALSEAPEEKSNPIRPAVCGMYNISHSGTWASPERRLAHVKRLLQSDDEKNQVLGSEFLRAALDMDSRLAVDQINMGSWSRDSGYRPKSRDEFVSWHAAFINLVIECSDAGGRRALLAKKVLASHFRRLWSYPQIRGNLEDALRKIRKSGFWPEGWEAIRTTFYFDSEKENDDDENSDPAPERLRALDKILRPAELIDRAKAFASAGHSEYGMSSVELEHTYQGDKNGGADDYRRFEQAAETVAFETAKNMPVLRALLPELFVSRGQASYNFGRGLAKGAENLAEMWRLLKKAASQIPPDELDTRPLKGFIHAVDADKPEFASQILDELVSDEALGSRFPDFQITVKIGDDGCRRLLRSLDLGMVSTPHYVMLGLGRAHESLNDSQISEILTRMLNRDDGLETAAEILKMRFLGADKKRYSPEPVILRAAQRILESAPVKKEPKAMYGHNLSSIAKHALRFEGGEAAAQALCAKFRKESEEHYIPTSYYQEVFSIVADTHPHVLLDNFVGNPSWRGAFGHWDEEEDNPILRISSDIIVKWCSKNPDERCAAIAREVRLYKKNSGVRSYVWRPVFWKLLGLVSGKAKFLEVVNGNIVPRSWSGDLSFHIENRMCLFKEILDHLDPELKNWAEEGLQRLKEWAAAERKHEEDHKSQEHESFE